MEDSFDFLVVIPTHKRAEAVRAAIASALSQAGVTKQIIVADDCPEGSAAGVVKDFPEVIYLKNPHPSHGWPGRVRNFAFDFSHEMGTKARYVHFLDDDDTVPEGHYAVVKETFRQHPNIGVVFGVLRPFSTFSDDPDRRTRQERQLEDVRKWRLEAASFPWLYQQVGRSLKLPVITQWLLCQHATFGPEMFLCSAGVIRHKHVLELRGFPDIRITQDYWF
jgi:glycosyltransferase involved in cell wall biosynthesis